MANLLNLPVEIRLMIYDYLPELHTTRVSNQATEHYTCDTGQLRCKPQTKKLTHALQSTHRQLRDEVMNLPIRHLDFTISMNSTLGGRPDIEFLKIWLKDSPLAERALIQTIKVSSQPVRGCGHLRKKRASILIDINRYCQVILNNEPCDACNSSYRQTIDWSAFVNSREASVLKVFEHSVFWDWHQGRRVFKRASIHDLGNQLRLCICR
ncbi:hypothetical protein MBLNU457_g1008t1 [Dothideomycetes sp. NU457]